MSKSSERIRRFRLHQDFTFTSHIIGVSFKNEYIQVEPSGQITLFEGCLSDGCSPTYRLPFSGFFQFGWIVGPPNGPPHPEHSHLPVSFKAFFAHDMLLEHCKHLICTDDIHTVFCSLLSRESWRWKRLACWVVKRFGPSNMSSCRQ